MVGGVEEIGPGEPFQDPDSQHDRQRPQFPDRQGRDLLIFLYKSGGLIQVDLALAVRHPFSRQPKYSGMSLKRRTA